MKKVDLLVYSLIIGTILLGCKEDGNEKSSRVENLPYYNEASFTPHWLGFEDQILDNYHRIPDFSLINQDGDTVTAKTFENKIYITDFFFTSCPGICPKMMSNMSLLQEEFKDDDEVLLLSHSVSPDHDTVEVLKNYAESKGIQSNKWHLVTGDKELIYTLGRQSYFVEEDLGITNPEYDFLHTENFVLIDKNKHIRGIYNGLKTNSIQQLIADIKTLKKESKL